MSQYLNPIKTNHKKVLIHISDRISVNNLSNIVSQKTKTHQKARRKNQTHTTWIIITGSKHTYYKLKQMNTNIN